MIKYARIINTNTGEVEVGQTSNTEYYKSIGMSEMDVLQSDVDGNWYLAEKCPMKSDEQKAQEEKERILALSMTRSDFFDGTIKAFGADSEDLLIAVQSVLENLPISDVEKKVAINNYKNALNFYRKHPLFEMLSNKPIQLTPDISIVITSEQWDKFFDETNKGNTDAYKELLPIAK